MEERLWRSQAYREGSILGLLDRFLGGLNEDKRLTPSVLAPSGATAACIQARSRPGPLLDGDGHMWDGGRSHGDLEV